MSSGERNDTAHELRLDSWKSIARHLGRSIRTVQRWHFRYDMPVRHLGGEGGSVFAFASELDAWLRDRDRTTAENQAPSAPGPVLLGQPSAQSEPTNPKVMTATFAIIGRRESQSADLVTLAHKMWQSLSQTNLAEIATTFREAIDLDPGNARAFAGLSLTLIAEGLLGILPTSAAYPQAGAALNRALEIDAELPEAKCAAAFLKMLVARDWDSARDEFDEGLDERPKSTHWLVGRALLFIAEGSLSQASDLLMKASSQNPLSTPSVALRCWCEYLAGRFEQTRALCALARSSGHTGAVLDATEALTLVQLGKPHADVRRLELLAGESPHHYVLHGVLGYFYALSGREDKARAIVKTLNQSCMGRKNDYPYATTLPLIGLNDAQKAKECLVDSYRSGSLWSLGFLSDPILIRSRSGKWNWTVIDSLSYPESIRCTLETGARAGRGF